MINQARTGKPAAVRVLIVDDSTQVRHDLKTFLSLSDEIEIVGEAGNGEEAITQAAALRPDVVVMDLEMPVMDGYTAAGKIKASRYAGRVVILSVHNGEAERKKAFQFGADAFVVKGMLVEDLMEVICKMKKG